MRLPATEESEWILLHGSRAWNRSTDYGCVLYGQVKVDIVLKVSSEHVKKTVGRTENAVMLAVVWDMFNTNMIIVLVRDVQ